MEFECFSDVGTGRENDEDAVVAVKLTAIFESKPVEVGIFIIADGMGGAQAGEYASRICSTYIISKVVNDLCNSGLSHDTIEEKIRKIIKEDNKMIMDEAEKNPEKYDGMGTTITMGIILGDSLHCFNVGDSRAYVINESSNDIKQITKDHSVVQDLIDEGNISIEEARSHPKGNIITRVLGHPSGMNVDYFRRNLYSDDILLLCCDGLTDMVSDDIIKEIALKKESLKEIAKDLVNEANVKGGVDNISGILVRPSQDILSKHRIISDTVIKSR